jgi:hypothetical protein
MEWLDEPPCTALTLQRSDLDAGKLELSGPAPASRMVGGFMTAFGAAFASGVIPFLRAPIPMPFKLVPLVVGGVGGGIAALGAAAATAKVSVLVERDKGVRFRWKFGPLRQREEFIPVEEIAALEVSHSVHTVNSDKHGFGGSTVMTYRLNLVTRAGKALGLESFGLHTQAKLRQEAIEAVLGLGEAATKEKPRRPRKSAGKR